MSEHPLNRERLGYFPGDEILSLSGFDKVVSRPVRLVAPYAGTVNCRVRPEEEGLPVETFLHGRFPFRDPDEWKRRLLNGWVSQGQRTLRPGDPVTRESPLALFHPEKTEPSVPDEIVLLGETTDYLLVYKPAPMPVHSGGRYNKNTLLSILLQQDRPIARNTSLVCSGPDALKNFRSKPPNTLRVIHRLDSVTSGIVIFGKTDTFTQKMHRAFAQRCLQKKYLALVRGEPDSGDVAIDTPIKRKEGLVFECSSSGKPALTRFRVVEKKAGKSVIMCLPETGRTHQIRLHLREWGYPVIDDPVYGAEPYVNTPEEKNKILQRHAISLLFYRLEVPGDDLFFDLFSMRGYPDSVVSRL